MLIDLYFMRHGETFGNYKGILQGHKDTGLNQTGLKQAASAFDVLADKGIKCIFVSPLPRAQQTAAIIKEKLQEKTGIKYQCITKEDLIEINLGTYEGQNKNVVDKINGKGALDRWLSQDPENDNADFCTVETKKALRKRAKKAMDNIIGQSSKKKFDKILVVGHGSFLANYLTLIGVRGSVMKNGNIAHLVYDTIEGTQKLKEVITNPYNKLKRCGLG